jgi:hypothetical protein
MLHSDVGLNLKEKITKLINIINGVSFSKEISKSRTEIFPELAVVQDADR